MARALPQWGILVGLAVLVGMRMAPAHAQGYVIQPPAAAPADTKPVLVPQTGHTDAVMSVAFSPDRRTLASGSDDKTIILWDAATGAQRATLTGHTDGLDSVAFSPDGRTLALRTHDQRVILWDAATGAQRATLAGHTDGVWSVAFSPDGRTLASGSRDRAVILWDAATGARRATLTGHTDGVWSVAFSPDGRTLASGSDQRIILWDAATGAQRATLTGHTDGLDSVAFSPDGRTLALQTHGKTVILWDSATGAKRILAGHTGEVNSVAFSPDGRTLASVSYDRAVILWDAATGAQRARLAGHTDWVWSVAFSPDGRTLASGSRDRAVILWDAATGAQRATLTGHTHGVWSVAFSPDGRTLASGSLDGTVILWDAAMPARRATLAGHTDRVTGMAFSPDGRTLASGSGDGTVRLWDAASGGELACLCSMDAGADYLATTPGGYYHASLEAAGKVVWRIGNEVFPFDQFSERFNRPDLVQRALAGEDIANAKPLEATQIPPNLGFVSPKYGAEVQGDTVEVELQAAGKYPIERVEVSVNGQPLPAELAQGLRIEKPTEVQRSFKLKLPLPPNEPRVRLRAIAYDTELLKSRPDELVLFRPGVKQSVGTLRVLAIGVNDYKDPALAKLKYAAPDATALAEALAKLGDGKPYTSVATKVLTDAQATLSNLKFALRELKDTATENDVAVVFIAGHGGLDEAGNYVFGNQDVDTKDLAHTALNWQDFIGALREVRAKRVLVLADTCHSGGIVGAEGNATDVLAYRLNKEAGRLVFTASSRDEASIGRAEWGHGAFTKGLLEALSGAADGDKDGSVTFRELRDFVPGRVEALTDGRQHPQLPFLDNYDPEAVLAQVR